MSKKKNLERAIVLGLILSTGVYGNVLAADPDGIGIDKFKGGAEDSIISVTENTIVNGTGYYGPDVSSGSGVNQPKHILKNSLFEEGDEGIVNLTVTAGAVQLTFNDVNMLSPHIVKAKGTNGADIYIVNENATTDTENSDKNFAGINVSAYIEGNSLTVNSIGRGIYTGVGKNAYPIIVDGQGYRNVSIDVNDQVKITSASDGIFNEGVNKGNVTITAGSVHIKNTDRNGIYNAGQSDDKENLMTITATNGNILIESGGDGADQASVKNKTEGSTTLKADVGSIKLTSKSNGIYATKGSTTLNSSAGNSIYAGDIVKNVAGTIKYGTKSAIHAFGGGIGENVTNVNLTTDKENYLLGAVYATGRAEKQEGKPEDPNKYDTNVMLSGGTNKVYSYTEIAGAGDINTTEDVIDGKENKFKDKRFISALYAEDGANIELTGENTVGTWAKSTDANTLERTVWAYSSDDKIGSTINLTGAADIRTNNYELSPKSADVAVAAGTATGLTAEIVNNFGKEADDKRSVVNINYADSATGGRSYIQGDILAAYAGEVNINPLAENSRAANNAGITITGNLLAGNNGVLIVDLGNGGKLTGRADDYGDAGVVENSGHGETFYDPAFSSDIYKGGDITLTMGDGSKWNVQGQSWITTLNTDGKVTIDLTNVADEYKNYDSHALTIRNLNGNADIIMDLDGNRSQSDMLYIGKGNGEYNIELENLVTVDDMYADGDGYKFSGLRFATVGMGSDVKFNVTAKDQGFNNVTYIVDTDVYNSEESKHENDAYNGESISNEKPGNSLVESMLNEAGKSKANEIMLLAADDEPVNDNETQHLNYKLVAMESSGITDAGKTMLNMSRANYSNAIYMDRLNKRLGEARYINSEEDEGMWVRIRHDRIGKDDAYRSQNTMYELGYDQKQECDNGERRVGMAIDYMHGDTGYDQIAGKGEIDRYGLWLYDTWMGDKGHYADYVAKWGHLSNDFEVYTMQNGDKVTGDYSNNVFSVSAEYGRKKDIGNDWYFEPQVQAQLARVTGADYTTNQGTKVSVDGINSLIGRAGFRLGKDFGEEKQSTVYIKADVLHEFLGDQDIRAFDGTTSGWQTVSYENEGTWYDVGLGFAAMMSKSSYAFLDLERSFGHDNDETYQINVGMQWSF